METVKKYETKDYNNFSSVVFYPGAEAGSYQHVIGRIICCHDRFEAISPLTTGRSLGYWPTKKEAVEAIIKNHKI